jgi:predicted deacylase
MKYLGLQKGRVQVKRTPVVISESKWIRAPHSGMFQSRVKNGTKVKHKSNLGKITDPYGEFEKNILAPFDCYVYGVNTAPIVHKGDALFHVSLKLA